MFFAPAPILYIPEGFYAEAQPNGSYFTIPRRYINIQPFQADRPFVALRQAYDTVRARDVVIKKVILPDDLTDRVTWKRAQRELYCMMHIEHENIVQMLSCFTPARTVDEMTEFYIVREYMQGTIKQIIPSTLLDHSPIQSVFFDICRGAQCLHSINVSHRDLKPGNCLIGSESEAKLCDFGHSNWDDPTANTPYIVQRYYRAPEIICETNDKNKTSVDIWSLGCIFAELLTGNVLFQGKDPVDQFLKIVYYLGNPDEIFYGAMHKRASDFFKNYNLDRITTPAGSLRDRFPNEWFQGNLGSDLEQCDLARDLLFKMIIVNPGERINIQTILTHPYFAQIWKENPGMELEPPMQIDQFLRTNFDFQNFVPPADMKVEIFQKLQEFNRNYNVLTSSKH